MAQGFVGPVVVSNEATPIDPTTGARIVLNPNNAPEVAIGGAGSAGSLRVTTEDGAADLFAYIGATGVLRISDGTTHEATLEYFSGTNTFEMGKVLVLHAASDSDNILVRDASGKRAFAVHNNAFGNACGVFVGAPHTDGGKRRGVIVVRDDAGRDRVRLYADPDDDNILVHNPEGRRVFAVHNNAFATSSDGAGCGVFVGAPAADGGHRHGVVAIRDRAGNDGIVLNGAQGVIVVRNADGKDAIVLNGPAGDVILANADCAEDFPLSADEVEPGTVMVLSANGGLTPSCSPYDRKVVGVVSGAGGRKAGIVLGRTGSSDARVPIALAGTVYCKVDAGEFPIDQGDLLTTSARPGHAMKVTDPLKALGAIVGKALAPLASGQGLIPLLVSVR